MAGSLDKEYELRFFAANRFRRVKCRTCGASFWTQDAKRDDCGDPPCAEYRFIGAPVTDRPYSVPDMRERFLSFFERRGHTRVARYPVIARWRDDIYLTIASIADFQPHVTSGLVPPPANPLAISQPCIRLNDLDSVGRSGRHLTNFEMMAHHAFNAPGREIYWKEETVAYCHEFLTDALGMESSAVTYKEKPWAGGGNAGPAFEVLIGGLEVATLVFMSLVEDPKGPHELYGLKYRPMDQRIVDTGYGLERFAWASAGTPTIYDCLYPDLVRALVDEAGVAHDLADERYAAILADHARFASMMAVDTGAKLRELRKVVAKRITERGHAVTPDELERILAPLERVYGVADHTRCLAFMLGDGIVPSNAKAGYLARLVLRRTMRLLDELGIDRPIEEWILRQLDVLGKDHKDLRAARDGVQTIARLEAERYRETIDRGRRLVASTVRSLGKGARLADERLLEFYDSHGVSPEIVREVAEAAGVAVDVPDDFYQRVAARHGQAAAETQAAAAPRKVDAPATKLLYYENPMQPEFEAVVLWSKEGEVALDQTCFYPEGGGQPSDTGHLTTEGGSVEVLGASKVGDVVVHKTSGRLKRGTVVRGRVDWGKRMAHTRHHTATHIVLGAARHVLGDHVWQTGAQKGADRSRIDVTHFRRVTPEELREIEQLANVIVMEDLPVEKTWMDRGEAEKRFGVRLYQGGVPTGAKVRVVRIPEFDVECCAGTHVRSTSDTGLIKILRSDRLQDGVERIEFAAGLAAVREIQRLEVLLGDAAKAAGAPADDLPKAVQRLAEAERSARKQAEELQKRLASGAVEAAREERVGDVAIRAFAPSEDELAALVARAGHLTREANLVVLLGGTAGGAASFVAAASKDVGLDLGAVLAPVLKKPGRSGGGKGTIVRGKAASAADLPKLLAEAAAAVKAALAR